MTVSHRHFIYFFFFQAEDGIRDYKVTGVQTCALPILWGSRKNFCFADTRNTLWREGWASGLPPSACLWCLVPPTWGTPGKELRERPTWWSRVWSSRWPCVEPGISG